MLGGLLMAWFPAHPAPALWWAVAAPLGVAVAYRAGREVVSGTAEPAGGGDAAVAVGRGTADRSTPGVASDRPGPGRVIAASDGSVTGSHQ
jgi:hypothetical protein